MRRPFAAFGLIVLLVLIIFANIQKKNIEYYNKISSFDGDFVTISGKVVNTEIKNDNQVLYLKCVSSNSAYFPIEKNIGVICYLKDCETVTLGSFLMLEGQVKIFNTATNEGEFDLKEYYLSQGYYFILNNAFIIAENNSENHLSDKLDKLKGKFANITDKIFWPDDAGIIKAMVLGEKETLNKDIKSLYQKSGICHILAISGLHVSLIGLFIYSLLKKAGMNIYLRTIIPSVIMMLYGIMTGLGISTFRAVIMFLLLMVSYLLRRTYDLPTGLVAAALVTIFFNKYACLSSTFYLSFMAVTGIAVFSRGMIVRTDRINKKLLKFFNTIITGLSVNFFTLPLILNYYYEYPMYSVLLNFFVVPLMGVLLGFAIVAIIVGSFNTFAGGIIAVPCHYILEFYESLCNFCERLPYNHLMLGKPTLLRIIIFYILMAVIILISNVDMDNCKKKFGIAAINIIQMAIKLSLILLGIILMIRPAAKLKVSMLDVGQGDGIVIMADGINIMVDGGTSSKKEIGKYILTPFLKSNAVSEIDYWLVSHPDSDHTSGLIELMSSDSSIKIKTIILPDTKTIKNDAYEIIQLANTNQIPVSYVSRGEKIVSKSLSIEFINPDKNKFYDDVNTYSETFILSYKNIEMLFTGDADTNSEEDYIKYCAENNVDLTNVDIFKVPHHGSNTSSGQKLINVINPKVSLISSGRNNRYGHPSKDVINRLTQSETAIYNTQNCGQITVVYKNNKCEIVEFIKKKEE